MLSRTVYKMLRQAASVFVASALVVLLVRYAFNDYSQGLYMRHDYYVVFWSLAFLRSIVVLGITVVPIRKDLVTYPYLICMTMTSSVLGTLAPTLLTREITGPIFDLVVSMHLLALVWYVGLRYESKPQQ